MRDFFSQHLSDLVWIFVLLFLGRVLLPRVIKRFIAHMQKKLNGRSPSLREKRAKTLFQLLSVTGRLVIYVAVFVMLLRMFGVETTPILASAGVLGLAAGFGMQAIIKDFMSGIFLLMENQFTVGDQVKIGSFEGVVKTINTRSTILKDNDGNTVFISNGSITQVVNLSMNTQRQNEQAHKDRAEESSRTSIT